MKLSSPIAALVLALLVFPLPGFADDSFEGIAKSAWISGRIETIYTLHRHLNPLDINTSVNASAVSLAGNSNAKGLQIDVDTKEYFGALVVACPSLPKTIRPGNSP